MPHFSLKSSDIMRSGPGAWRAKLQQDDGRKESPAEPATPADGRKRGIPIEVILASYQRTRSVWETAKEVGLSGQNVHRRLEKIGATNPPNLLSESEKEQIREAYSRPWKKGDGVLAALAKSLGRTRHFICRYARSAGLTNARRKCNEESRRKTGERIAKLIMENGHPRGALGMKHTEKTKSVIGFKSAMRMASMSEQDHAERTMKILRTRLANHGTLATPRKNVSWKQGWREIGGRRIYFRSRWEFNYAVYLEFLVQNKQIIKWDHEPDTFWFEGIRRGCVSYLPDFRVVLPDGSYEYHEVKGWMDARSKTKLKRMAKYYPTVKLRVIDAKWFKANAAKLVWLPGWEKGGQYR